MPLRVAVIGGGAAGLGALTELLAPGRQVEVTLIDINRAIAPEPEVESPTAEWIAGYYDGIYRALRERSSYKFPPPKTHLGEPIPRQPLGDKLSLFKSESLGGLTNYWGATLLPFTERELARWPARRDELTPYYRRLAGLVGLSGRPDELNEYFGDDFATLPPIRPTAVLGRLNDSINARAGREDGPYRVVSGLNRAAIETRPGRANSCVYCGECMAGCFRGSVYSAARTIRRYLEDPRVTRFIPGEVRRIDPRTRSLEVSVGSATEALSGFDKVFLCAGCPASTEILLRSAGLREGPVMTDNAVYVFPILYFGRLPRGADEGPYLSQCNLIWACQPRDGAGHFAQVQVYPNFDYLWRYNIPPRLWPAFRPLLRRLRPRIAWGRLYVHSDHSQAYALRLEDDALRMDVARRPGEQPAVEALLRIVRRSVNHEGFHIPTVKPILQKTNSHYGGTFPYGGPLLTMPAGGAVFPGVYACDSACFPDSPAVSPTFTIMANAARTAALALQD